MARQLAINAKNFGTSFLRVEDYYCYWATALREVSKVALPSALSPFHAQLVNPSNKDKKLNKE